MAVQRDYAGPTAALPDRSDSRAVRITPSPSGASGRVGTDTGRSVSLRPLAVAGAATLAFGLTALALSWLTGAPFTVPTERISRAVGVHYLVPFVIGSVGYCLFQIAAYCLGGAAADRRTALENAKADGIFLILFAVVIYVHFHIKMWIPVINPAVYDALYLSIDRQFQGVIDVLLALRAAMAPLLPGVDLWYQVGFQLLFAASLWFHSIGHRRYHYHNLVAILLLEMVGALAYLVAPAVGPFIYEPGLNAVATPSQEAMHGMFQQAQRFGTAWLQQHGGDYFTAPPAAMPSLHVGVAWIITYYAFKARLILMPFMAFLFVWFLAESVASRWHYLIDLPAGLLLAVAVIAVTNRICRQPERVAPVHRGQIQRSLRGDARPAQGWRAWLRRLGGPMDGWR